MAIDAWNLRAASVRRQQSAASADGTVSLYVTGCRLKHCDGEFSPSGRWFCRILSHWRVYGGTIDDEIGVELLDSLVLAAIHGALWGLLRTALTLWLRGLYFAVATFAFAGVLYAVVKHGGESIGASDGTVYGIPAPTILGHELYYNWQHYYHILCLLALAVFVAYRLTGSRMVLTDAGKLEHAAENVEPQLRHSHGFLAFAISAAIGAIGGAFFAQFRANINPDAFAPWESILVLCMVVVGGLGSIRGAILGAGIIGLANEVLRLMIPIQFSSLRYLVFGALALLVLRCCPAGLLSVRR